MRYTVDIYLATNVTVTVEAEDIMDARQKGKDMVLDDYASYIDEITDCEVTFCTEE